jgi:hypothetical protein
VVWSYGVKPRHFYQHGVIHGQRHGTAGALLARYSLELWVRAVPLSRSKPVAFCEDAGAALVRDPTRATAVAMVIAYPRRRLRSRLKFLTGNSPSGRLHVLQRSPAEEIGSARKCPFPGMWFT